MGTKVEIGNISKTFGSNESQVFALKDVSFTVEEGSFVVIIGPSGCGKTSLLRIIDGLIPPSGGEVLIDGRPIAGPGPDRSIVFQNFRLLPWRRVLGNVEMGLEINGTDKNERHELARRYLELVGLKGFENHYPIELSGGMQQRVGLARALVVNPAILLMDEPFGSVDAQTREQLQTELLKLWSKTRKTVIFVTHDIDEAIYLGDEIVIISPRPGTVREIVTVNLPRPRWESKADIIESAVFVNLKKKLWKALGLL
ncbi:MAG: ABC transporter ATP-binding protein [Candidatus Binatia bacterium]